MARILVIDDDPWIRTMVRHLLEYSGHRVTEAQDGLKGTELMRRQSADLIITDISMPGQDGWETIVAIRKDFPDVKIIAISGGPVNETRFNLALAEQLGAQRIFSKPVESERLLTAISQLLGGQ
jgi:CheY-like chemotaxis protein